MKRVLIIYHSVYCDMNILYCGFKYRINWLIIHSVYQCGGCSYKRRLMAHYVTSLLNSITMFARLIDYTFVRYQYNLTPLKHYTNITKRCNNLVKWKSTGEVSCTLNETQFNSLWSYTFFSEVPTSLRTCLHSLYLSSLQCPSTKPIPPIHPFLDGSWSLIP